MTIGCYHYLTNEIHITRGLSPATRDCVISHELRHRNGDTHDLGPVQALVCGNGELMPWIGL